MRYLLIKTAPFMAALLLTACAESEQPAAPAAPEQTAEAADLGDQIKQTVEQAAEKVKEASAQVGLAAILAAQPEEVRARYVFRNPQQTLEFFGIEPGMTVVEALPGAGWYSKLLLPYLGAEGHLIGVNYAPDLWPNFSFATEEMLAEMATWTTTWTEGAEGWREADSATVSAFVFGDVDASLHGTADAVLFVRALHNMARFSSERDFLAEALGNTYDILKPGGVVGIVQHEARADAPDDWANGSNGYLKRDYVIAQMEAAGFEFIEASDVNQNPKDQPGTEDIVWRLPPSLATSRENEELKAQMIAIGESNRMTLKFRKPA